MKTKGRHTRCPATASFGLNEYDAHSHRCTLARQHTGEHDYTQCPEGRMNEHTKDLDGRCTVCTT